MSIRYDLDVFLFSEASKSEYGVNDSSYSLLDGIVDGLISFCVNSLDFDGCAENDLGILYCLGKGVKKNYDEAAVKFKISCDLGNAQAYFNLGVLNFYKLSSNPVESSQHFSQALDRGIIEANYYIGLLKSRDVKMIRGHNLASDRADAIEEAVIRAVPYFKKSAGVNHILSLKELGETYNYAFDIKDTQLALQYFLRAATLGDIDSMMRAADILIDGYCPRVVDFLRQDVNGYINSGEQYTNSERNWLNEHYDNASRVATIRECFKNTTKDIKGAMKLLSRAIELGSGKARARLADIYFSHLNDPSTAIELCHGGANDDIDCLFILAKIYQSSDVFKNECKALEIYKECISLMKKQKEFGVYYNTTIMIEARLAISRLEKLNS